MQNPGIQSSKQFTSFCLPFLTLQYFKPKMANLNQPSPSVIDLDDEDNHTPPNPHKPPLPPTAKGVNPVVFPKLFNLIQKFNELKTKKGQEKKEEQRVEPAPQVIAPPNTENEVSMVVSITPSLSQLLRQKEAEERQAREREAAASMQKEETVTDHILLVEQALEPLIPICPPIQIQPTVIQVNQEIHQNQEPPVQVIQPVTIDPQNMPVQSPSQQMHHNLDEITANLEQNPPQIENESLIVQANQVEEPQQVPTEVPQPVIVQQEPYNASVVINLSLAENENKDQNPAEQARLQLQPISAQTSQTMQIIVFRQIKGFLMKMLPDMVEAINEMNNSDLFEVFKQMKGDNSSQDDLKSIFVQIQGHNTVHSQEIRPHSKIDFNPNWDQKNMLKYMKTLPFEDLKNLMKKYYEHLANLFDILPFSQLRKAVNEALELLQKEDKSHQCREIHESSVPAQVHSTPVVVHSQQTLEQAVLKEATVAEMRQFLLESIPSIRAERLQSVNDQYVKKLYDGAKHGLFSRSEIAQKVGSYSPSILGLCSKKFPSLQNSINKISQQTAVEICESIVSKSNKVQVNPQAKKISSSSNENALSGSQKSVILQSEESPNAHSLKRTHQEMRGSNPRKNDENKAEPKKKYYSNIREKLLLKLPELKDNIMKLDDSEIQKVYRDSIELEQSQSSSSGKKQHKEAEARPVIIMKNSKPANVLKPNELLREEEKIRSQTTQNNEKGKKCDKRRTTRTIIFVHTEQLSDEELQNGIKARRTENGIEKKSSCECFQNASVSELLKKLTQLIENKS